LNRLKVGYERLNKILYTQDFALPIRTLLRTASKEDKWLADSDLGRGDGATKLIGASKPQQGCVEASMFDPEIRVVESVDRL